jgi:1,4-dihydroxy-2-naphthoate octaprenyltransferase
MPERTAWRHWVEAARPRTLPAAVIPVLVATALAAAHGRADYVSAGICLAFALLVQVGTNFANDYFDFVKGADTAARVGPRRAVAAGLIAPRAMRAATGLVMGAAFAVGLVLAVRFGGSLASLFTGTGVGLLAVGVLSILSGLAYTGGPWPLGYNGLGDVFVFVFFGLVAVDTTFFVQAGYIGPDATSCGAALGLLAANILVANNYRDVETDAAAGKKTLVVRFGRRFALWQYALSLIVAMLCPPALQLFGYDWPVLLPFLLMPWGCRLVRRLETAGEPAEQIQLLGDTAKFLAAFGVLLGAGVWFGR